MSTCWKVALMKVEVTEEEYSLHPTATEAMAAAGELEKFLGLLDSLEYRLVVKHSPVTGERLLIDIEEVDSD